MAMWKSILLWVFVILLVLAIAIFFLAYLKRIPFPGVPAI